MCRLGIYSNDAGHLEELLNENHELLSSQTVRIYGLLVELIPVIENLAQQLNLQVTFLSKEEPRNITELHFPPESTQTIRQVIVRYPYLGIIIRPSTPQNHEGTVYTLFRSYLTYLFLKRLYLWNILAGNTSARFLTESYQYHTIIV